MRFLFVTLQFAESDFYGRVSERLAERGLEWAHVAVFAARGRGSAPPGQPLTGCQAVRRWLSDQPYEAQQRLGRRIMDRFGSSG